MRIGVLTHSTGDDNYGQILQCYALQQFLKQIGHNPFLIQYEVDNESCSDKFIYLKNIVRHIRSILSPKYRKAYKMLNVIKKQRELNERLNKERKFEQFRYENIELSRFYYSIEDLRNDPPIADVYIVGSDQVWIPSINSTSALAWYLQFGPQSVKRISYAASFGRIVHETEFKRLYEFLHKFTAVSVREHNALDYCRRAGVDNTKLVLDPTLLVAEDVYKHFIKNDFTAKPYLFLYYINVIDKDDVSWNQIEAFLVEKNLELRTVSSSGYYPAFDLIPGHDNLLLTIPEWLNSIYNSEYVVTTSFHGVAFAIIMHRPFVAILLKGIYSGGNNRILSLLTDLGLVERILTNDKSISDILSTPIDWDKVDKLLLFQRKTSEDFLREALEL